MLTAALDESLHYRRGSACLASLHPPVSLVYDEVQPPGFFPRCVLYRLPYRVLPHVRVPAEIPCPAKFLRVQEVYMTVIKHPHAEAVLIAYPHALFRSNHIRLAEYFLH